MIGELTLIGTAPFCDAIWEMGPDVPKLLRANHDPHHDPIGMITSLSLADSGFQVTAAIAVSQSALVSLRCCPVLSAAGYQRGATVELTEISVIDVPANTEVDDRARWSVTGRLPRVVVEWAHVREWCNGGEIRLFEVGRDVHGDLIEADYAYRVDDAVVYREWFR